jgi:hypothetical protein
MDDLKISCLIGCIIDSIEVDPNKEWIVFNCAHGERFKMWHDQDCCEGVTIEDICGDLDDLIGAPIVMAEEAVHDNVDPEGMDYHKNDEYRDSFTWTFYKLATVKGYVTIRWYGESNGYYSESVTFSRMEDSACC